MRSGELALIDAFLRPFGLARDGAKGPGVLAGPGDDCAVVQPSRGMKLVVKTDEAVEGVHFTLPRFSPADVGHKALAVNLSDLAAAGARPRWFVCALGVPRRRDVVRTASGIARGMARLARVHEVALVGGNVSRAPAWSLAICALGEAARPRGRRGARPGDALVVVGQLGAAALGLRRKGAAGLAQRRPTPLVDDGLAAGGLPSASIDVSDGFLRDLGHLCEASGCGAEVDLERLPVARGATLDDALSGGEDYALLFAVPPRNLEGLRRSVHRATIAGRFVRGRAIRLLDRGRPRPLPSRRGFDHLA
jgi:thiamine-monophosphate kinase